MPQKQTTFTRAPTLIQRTFVWTYVYVYACVQVCGYGFRHPLARKKNQFSKIHYMHIFHIRAPMLSNIAQQGSIYICVCNQTYACICCSGVWTTMKGLDRRSNSVRDACERDGNRPAKGHTMGIQYGCMPERTCCKRTWLPSACVTCTHERSLE